jgi:hypothetical protein
MMKQRVRIIFSFLIVLCTVIVACISAPAASALTVSAASLGNANIETTSVMSDLYGAKLNGVPFDIQDYPTRAAAPIEMIHFAEYGYSYFPSSMSNFGLYVYIYNPSLQNIVTSTNNRIQMASAYYGDHVTQYEKYSLQLMSKSTGNTEGLFYKFKVVLTPAQCEKLINRQNTHERRYDISGIEFFFNGQPNAKDYEIGRTYYFRGFSAGYGGQADAPSTLETQVVGMKTLNLDVKHTWYRTETSDKGIGHQNQINTVYFSVPNNVLEEYGKLQKIMAEWWEYQTRPVVVTSDQKIYNNLSPKVGQNVLHNDDYFSLYLQYDAQSENNLWKPNVATWAYNNTKRYPDILNNRINVGEVDPYLDYLFKVDSIQKYQSSKMPVGAISSQSLTDWIMNYSNSRNGYISISGNRQISADLFTNTIDQERLNNGIRRGYNCIETDADDTQDMRFYDGVRLNGWWNRFWGNEYTFGNKINRTVKPIESLPTVFPSGTDAQVAENLFINTEDISALRNYHSAANQKNETVFLFRFAITDYYADWLFAYKANHGFLGLGDDYIDGKAYLAKETVFLDFDIIQLTFQGELDSYVMPVVSNPQDIIASITPPAHDPPAVNKQSWWRWIIGLIVFLILLWIFLPIIALAAVLILKGLKFAFISIMSLFSSIKKRGQT